MTPKANEQISDYMKTQLALALANAAKQKNKNAIRYYFWEWVPHYGFRQMGYSSGYSSISELKTHEAFLIKNNKKRGYPSFIMKAKVIEVL